MPGSDFNFAMFFIDDLALLASERVRSFGLVMQRWNHRVYILAGDPTGPDDLMTRPALLAERSEKRIPCHSRVPNYA